MTYTKMPKYGENMQRAYIVVWQPMDYRNAISDYIRAENVGTAIHKAKMNRGIPHDKPYKLHSAIQIEDDATFYFVAGYGYE